MQKVFIDTNILVYSIDENSSEKYGKSIAFLNKLEESNIVTISTQSLKEFINVSIKKLRISKESTMKLVDILSEKFRIHQNSVSTIKHALQISIKTQFSFWDSLILAAANESGCSILYSEDLNNGQIVDGVKIVNPFLV